MGCRCGRRKASVPDARGGGGLRLVGGSVGLRLGGEAIDPQALRYRPRSARGLRRAGSRGSRMRRGEMVISRIAWRRQSGRRDGSLRSQARAGWRRAPHWSPAALAVTEVLGFYLKLKEFSEFLDFYPQLLALTPPATSLSPPWRSPGSIPPGAARRTVPGSSPCRRPAPPSNHLGSQRCDADEAE
jgi:hypothetical protein